MSVWPPGRVTLEARAHAWVESTGLTASRGKGRSPSWQVVLMGSVPAATPAPVGRALVGCFVQIDNLSVPQALAK